MVKLVINLQSSLQFLQVPGFHTKSMAPLSVAVQRGSPPTEKELDERIAPLGVPD